MATYYWVGGTGTWSGTGNTQFAITSGGVATALNPTNADTVNFDANSGTAATVTVTATAVSLSTIVNKSDINLSLSGSPTLCTAAGTFTLTAGTVTLNTFTMSIGILSSSNTNARAIAFGTGAINVTGNNTNVVNMNDATSFTYTGTSKVNLTYSGATGGRQYLFGGIAGASSANAMNVYVTAGTDAFTLANSQSVRTLDFTGFSGSQATNSGSVLIYGDLIFSSTMTVATGGVGGTYNMAAASGTSKIKSNAISIDRPIALSSGAFALQDNLLLTSTRLFSMATASLDLGGFTATCGLFSCTGATTRSIAFGTTGQITVTGNNTTVITFANSTGFSYTGTPTFNATYSGATGIRTINLGASGGATESNAVNVNISAGTDTVTLTASSSTKNLIFTGFAGTLSNTALTVYGNLTYASGMTLTAGASATTFAATSGTQAITTAAKTLDFPLTFNGVGGTFAFQDALTQGSTRAFTITNGTVQLKAGVTSTVGSFVANSATMKYLQSTLAGTQATLSQASGTVNASNLTIKDINATGGATWNAYYINGDINAGNNTGWDFLVQLGRYIYSRRKNKVILN